jgi:flagellar assembly factor FliW
VVIDHPEGPLEVPASAVVQLTEPLYGFPDRLEYVLIPAARQGLWWFISVHQPTVTFVVADPFVGKPEFSIDLGEIERQQLGIAAVDDVLVLVMLALPGPAGGDVTANFRAPVVLNLRTRVGMQILGTRETDRLAEPVDLARYAMVD